MPSSWTNGGKKGYDLREKKKGKEVAHCSRSLLTNMPQLAFPLLRLLEQEGRRKEKQYTYVSVSTEMLNSCDRFRNDTARMEIKKIQNEASLQNLIWSLQKFQVHDFLLHLIAPSLGIIELHLFFEKTYWCSVGEEEEKTTGWSQGSSLEENW